MKLVAFLSTILAFLVPSVSSEPGDRHSTMRVRYYLIDGPDYRAVAPATFASYAPRCHPNVVRRYPDVGVVTHLCYL